MYVEKYLARRAKRGPLNFIPSREFKHRDEQRELYSLSGPHVGPLQYLCLHVHAQQGGVMVAIAICKKKKKKMPLKVLETPGVMKVAASFN